MTREQAQRNLFEHRAAAHPHCGVCGESGLGLSFQATLTGIEGRFACESRFQGYDGMVHGGIVSTLLDAAMTHCLFAQGKTAVTGELTVRFVLPVRVAREAIVRAGVTESCPPLYRMEAEVIQGGQVVARATAKFVETKWVQDTPQTEG